MNVQPIPQDSSSTTISIHQPLSRALPHIIVIVLVTIILLVYSITVDSYVRAAPVLLIGLAGLTLLVHQLLAHRQGFEFTSDGGQWSLKGALGNNTVDANGEVDEIL